MRREQKKVEAELTATILDKQKAEATIFDMVCSLERWQLQPILNGKEDFIAVNPMKKLARQHQTDSSLSINLSFGDATKYQCTRIL